MKRNSKTIYRAIYIFVIALLLATPLFCTAVQAVTAKSQGRVLFSDEPLTGVSSNFAKPVISKSALWNGEYQTAFEPYYAQNLVWRQSLTRVFNQITYSISGNTFSKENILGKDDYLFESSYATSYLSEMADSDREAIRASLEEIQNLRAVLYDYDIPIIVISTPSKAEYYSDKLPSAYDRYVEMKANGEYNQNANATLKEEIAKTDIPFYDRSNLFKEMAANGELLFTIGGSHWSLHPMEKYVNGLNTEIGQILGQNLGTLNVISEENNIGEMVKESDRDIFDIYTNALWAKPNYHSPNITFSTENANYTPNIFLVGGSFNWILLSTIYSNTPNIWGNADFSYYGGPITSYPQGNRTSETTDNYAQYLNKDIFIFELNERIYLPNSQLMRFVRNMLNYLNEHTVQIDTTYGVAERFGDTLVGNWSNIEDGIVLSDGNSAKIVARFSENVSKDLSLIISCELYGEPDIDVCVNGNQTSKLSRFAVDEALGLYLIDIPQQNELTKTVVVEFKINNPVSPLELGQSDDARKLGLGLQEFKFVSGRTE